MKVAGLAGLLMAAAVAACSATPGVGPVSADAVAAGAKQHGRILYDVVKVDDRVIGTVLAQPKPSFRTVFKPDGKPPAPAIAVGDTLSVVIWEAAPGGLFTAPLPSTLPTAPSLPIEPPAHKKKKKAEEDGTPSLDELLGGGGPVVAPPPVASGPMQPGAAVTEAMRALLEQQNRGGITLPTQVVAGDGTIAVPYAGRVPAAGRTVDQLQRDIEGRLATKALEPQIIVIDRGGPAHSVAVAGEVVHGARIPLPPGGDRLLQLIAEAGGARAPVYDLYVRLSRGPVTATLPLAALVADPAENIYAWPGDVLTVIRRPRSFSVLGAATRNAQIAFGAATLTLSEGLGKALWLQHALADARGIFVFRDERDPVVRALGEPLAAAARNGRSPIVYRFDMSDPKAMFLAQRFPLRNHDIIFIASAKVVPLYWWFRALSKITGPVEEGAIVCFTTSGC